MWDWSGWVLRGWLAGRTARERAEVPGCRHSFTGTNFAISILSLFWLDFPARLTTECCERCRPPPRTWIAAILAPLVWLVGVLSLTWLLSLNTASTLTAAAVGRASLAVQNVSQVYEAGGALGPAEWNATVRSPVIDLAVTTLPALSEWSFGVGWIVFGFGFQAVTELLGEKPRREEMCEGNKRWLVCLLVMVPALILWVPAQATEGCADLAASLNDLRAADMDGELQTRVSDLERYLDRLNGGQGPGFTALGWLVTHRLVYTWLVASLPVVNLVLARSGRAGRP